MSCTNRENRRLLVAGLWMLFACAIAEAANEAPPGPITNLEAQHQRLVREGEQASRAAPPAPLPSPSPNNGVLPIPLETVLSSAPSSKTGTQGNNGSSQSLGINALSAGAKTACLMKSFPEVAWQVCVTDMGLKGLWIGPVNLRRTPTAPWMRVVFQAGLAEIFVPYHQTNFRPYDLRWTTALNQVTSADAGSTGTLITLSNETIPTVVAEVRDRGVGWLCKQNTSITRRAEEFLVWGVIDGGNYDNIIQYGFRAMACGYGSERRRRRHRLSAKSQGTVRRPIASG
jgi:hypothetical protein